MRWSQPKSCRSCGGGGGGGGFDRWGVFAVILALAPLLLSGIVWAAGRLAERGTKVVDVSCDWSEAEQAYVARVVVASREDEPKLVTLNVRYDVRAPKGKRWPSANAKSHYSTMTQQMLMAFSGADTVTESNKLKIPIKGFSCKAVASISQQQRIGQSMRQVAHEAVETGTATWGEGVGDFALQAEIRAGPKAQFEDESGRIEAR